MSPPPASLVYYPNSRPGIRRKRCGRGFTYIAPDDTRIEQARERARIAALSVPPAYQNVWICPLPNGHLQATGFDARARKQYRYHEDWTAHRAELKYGHLAEFGAALPAIRRRIARDLAGEAGNRDYALAATLAMIDRMSVRVGNAGYAEENGAYGVTTLKSRHLRMTRDGMVLSFTAKGGTRVKKTVCHKKLQKVLDSLHDLGGAELISWIGDDGEPHSVRSDMVNDRLAEITGNDALTAKTFRTWNGSVAALEAALQGGQGDGQGDGGGRGGGAVQHADDRARLLHPSPRDRAGRGRLAARGRRARGQRPEAQRGAAAAPSGGLGAARRAA